jgi:hypothetical protein
VIVVTLELPLEAAYPPPIPEPVFKSCISIATYYSLACSVDGTEAASAFTFAKS